MIRAYDQAIFLVKWIGRAISDQSVKGLRVQDYARQVEFLLEFLLPLLSEYGRDNYQDSTAAFRPPLCQDNPRFDGLTKTNFISEDSAVGQWRTKREQGCIDLVWIKINTGVGNRAGEGFDVAAGTPEAQGVRPVLAVVSSTHCRVR